MSRILGLLILGIDFIQVIGLVTLEVWVGILHGQFCTVMFSEPNWPVMGPVARTFVKVLWLSGKSVCIRDFTVHSTCNGTVWNCG